MSTKHNSNTISKNWKSILLNSLLVIAIGGALVWGVVTYFDLGTELYTNDAQIEEFINPINSRIAGYIKEVRFTEHQYVNKGDTLILIDNREYKIQLEQAEASYLVAQASRSVVSSSINTVRSNLGVTDAHIQAAEARAWNAKQNYTRYENLLRDGAATQQQFDQVKSEYQALVSQVSALEQQRNTTTLSTEETSRKVMISDGEIKRAHGTVAMASLNLSYTVILAPYDGYTGRRTVQEGQLVQAGQTLLSFVRNDSKWVVANYKEKQITRLHVGQQVKLKVDGLPDQEFEGIVTAISQATGSRYSSVPVDNSSGNFIKVQQRIPVRIDFHIQKQELELVKQFRAGMNVEVKLDTTIK